MPNSGTPSFASSVSMRSDRRQFRVWFCCEPPLASSPVTESSPNMEYCGAGCSDISAEHTNIVSNSQSSIGGEIKKKKRKSHAVPARWRSSHFTATRSTEQCARGAMLKTQQTQTGNKHKPAFPRALHTHENPGNNPATVLRLTKIFNKHARQRAVFPSSRNRPEISRLMANFGGEKPEYNTQSSH
jgi:hypothetical protein